MPGRPTTRRPTSSSSSQCSIAAATDARATTQLARGIVDSPAGHAPCINAPSFVQQHIFRKETRMQTTGTQSDKGNLATGLFSDRESAERAYEDLSSRGYSSEDIN